MKELIFLKLGGSLITDKTQAYTPRLDIIEVRAGSDDTQLFSSLDDQGTTLRVNLREQLTRRV